MERCWLVFKGGATGELEMAQQKPSEAPQAGNWTILDTEMNWLLLVGNLSSCFTCKKSVWLVVGFEDDEDDSLVCWRRRHKTREREDDNNNYFVSATLLAAWKQLKSLAMVVTKDKDQRRDEREGEQVVFSFLFLHPCSAISGLSIGMEEIEHSSCCWINFSQFIQAETERNWSWL